MTDQPRPAQPSGRVPGSGPAPRGWLGGSAAGASGWFGPYRIDGLLGTGGMSTVYRAFDTDHARLVALKVLPESVAGDIEYRRRFRRESQIVARLREPHVIPIHRFGHIDGRLFIDMRLVDGLDVARLLARDGPLPPRRAVEIIAQVAAALHAAHRDSVVHRDVKPSNVLITTDGAEETDFAYLLDFGIARDGAVTTGVTASGAAIGTLAYMAPERFSGTDVDARADVYALGCVLYECLTGRPPFSGDNPALIHAHLAAAAPAPSALRADVPAGLDAVVARAMAKHPDQRYPSAVELAFAARQALSTPATDPDPRRRAVPVSGRDPGLPDPTGTERAEPATRALTTMWSRLGRGRPRRGTASLVSVTALLVASIVLAALLITHPGATPAQSPGGAPAPADPTAGWARLPSPGGWFSVAMPPGWARHNVADRTWMVFPSGCSADCVGFAVLGMAPAADAKAAMNISGREISALNRAGAVHLSADSTPVHGRDAQSVAFTISSPPVTVVGRAVVFALAPGQYGGLVVGRVTNKATTPTPQMIDSIVASLKLDN